MNSVLRDGVAVVLFTVGLAGAEVEIRHLLIRHEGATDPQDEGWRRVQVREGALTEGPLQEDPVGGLAAWSIEDNGTREHPVAVSYQRALHGREVHVISTQPWRYTLRLRVVEGASEPSFSVCGEVATASTRYLLRFGRDDDGNTVVTLGLRGEVVSATVSGVGYHRFDLVFDPGQGEAGAVSLFVDGADTPLIDGYAGEPSGSVASRLVWGSNQSATAGHGHYNLVEFAMASRPPAEPEPPPSVVAVDNVCAWPNLTILPNGDVAAVIYSLPSHGGGEGDAECWASRDQGNTWTLRGIPAKHEPGTCRMNLAAGLARNDDFVVLCSGWDKRDMSKERHARILKPLVSRSSDGGRSWTVTTDFPAEVGMSEFIPFGDIIQAQDGTLCVSAYAQTPGSQGYTYHAYFLRSDDDGHTWRRESVIAEGHNETALYQLPDGTWLAAARVDHMDIYRSGDNGRTWTAVARTSGAQHPGHFLRLRDGRLLLSHGERTPGIEGVGIRLSMDDGATWTPYSRHIGRALNRDCGYPSSIQLPDGRILTAWYAKGTPTHSNYHMAVTFWEANEVFGNVE